jgi:hypothetical protein
MAWTQQVKDQAITLAGTEGLGAAHKATGVPKPTIARWCKAASVDVMAVEQTKRATAVAKTDALVRRADRFEDYLEQIQVEAGRLVQTVATVNGAYALAVAGMDTGDIEELPNHVTGETFVTFRDPQVESLRLRVKALKELSVELPHAIGAFTRATHDLRLLREQSTENQAVQVVFSAGLAGPSASEVAALDEGAVIVEGEVME